MLSHLFLINSPLIGIAICIGLLFLRNRKRENFEKEQTELKRVECIKNENKRLKNENIIMKDSLMEILSMCKNANVDSKEKGEKIIMKDCLNCGRSMSEPKEESESEYDRLWCSHLEEYTDEENYCDEWC